MLIKKDKKSLFFNSNKVFIIFNSLFNKNFFSTILKFLGILQIVLIAYVFYIAIALDKEQIKTLLHATATKTYWLGKTLSNLPVKWSNKIASNHPILNLEIAPNDYQQLMLLKDDAIKTGHNTDKHKKKFSAVISYKNDKYDTQIRLKGDDTEFHLNNPKWSMRVTVNNDRFIGMKAFNLQHPARRSYIASFVLHKFVENENLTTKRFNLIPVAINGKYIGIYNYEEIPDHNMNETLTGINNIVVYIDDDNMGSDMKHAHTYKQRDELVISLDSYHHSIIKAHSFNDVLNDKILKKDFERASKIYNDFRNANLTASEVFDIDKVALWLAFTDLFGANHGRGAQNVKLIYNRDLDRLYPIVWDSINENAFTSVAFHKYEMFKLELAYFDMAYLLDQWFEDQNLVEKYLTKLDEITSPEYIDSVMDIIKPQVDEYMSILQLDYPQFKIEDELKRLKENADYLRGAYLYPEAPMNAYLPGDSEKDNLILVNRKPVPIKIIALIDTTTGKRFKIKGANPDFILAKNYPGKSSTPTKVFFECPLKDCFAENKIKNFRIIAKVLGTSKATSVEINNWAAYEL